MKKLMLVDGHNLLFRMYYGIPAPIKNSNGKDIRGVIGFIGGLLNLVNMDAIEELLVVFDSETSTISRAEASQEYKSNRVDYSEVPDEENPFAQLEYIYAALQYLNIDYIEVQNFEADDYIASIATALKDTHNITIVSTDRDFLQLVCDSVSVYNPRGKLSINFTQEKVYEKFNVYPHQIIDYKVLVGDKSDNIKGVPQIGPKTAVKILNQGSLSDICEGKVKIEEKLQIKIYDNIELIEKNQRLITMISNIEISNNDYSIKFNKKIKTMEILNGCGIR